MLVKPSISPGIYVFEHVQFSVSTELTCELWTMQFNNLVSITASTYRP